MFKITQKDGVTKNALELMSYKLQTLVICVSSNFLCTVFCKIQNSCLEKADGHTRKKHSMKFRHIGYNVDPYGQSFFPNSISAWNGLAKNIAETNTLDIFKSILQNMTSSPIHERTYS